MEDRVDGEGERLGGGDLGGLRQGEEGQALQGHRVERAEEKRVRDRMVDDGDRGWGGERGARR